MYGSYIPEIFAYATETCINVNMSCVVLYLHMFKRRYANMFSLYMNIPVLHVRKFDVM